MDAARGAVHLYKRLDFLLSNGRNPAARGFRGF